MNLDTFAQSEDLCTVSDWMDASGVYLPIVHCGRGGLLKGGIIWSSVYKFCIFIWHMP